MCKYLKKRKSLQDVNFHLDDKFCDETDLKLSWGSFDIPEPYLMFLSKLFDVNKDDLSKKQCDYDLIDSSLTISNEVKLLRIRSLFQIMHFIKYKGKVKTPLQTLIGSFIFNTTRSKTTVKILNRLGLSISYEEILRVRTRLATYAKLTFETSIPLASHFNTESYVTDAFDNFDHNEATLSGLGATHDTVAVIFQDFHANDFKTKPNVSSIFTDNRSRSFTTHLKCQELQNFRML